MGSRTTPGRSDARALAPAGYDHTVGTQVCLFSRLITQPSSRAPLQDAAVGKSERGSGAMDGEVVACILGEQVHLGCSFGLLRLRSEFFEQAGDEATGYPFQIRHSGRRERVELNISVGSLGKYPVRYQRVEVKV